MGKLLLETSQETQNYSLGSVHKRRPNHEREFLQCGHFADKGERVLQMRISALFEAKPLDFSKFVWCIRTDKEGEFEPVRTLYGQGGGIIFRDFMRTSFMGGPLLIYA